MTFVVCDWSAGFVPIDLTLQCYSKAFNRYDLLVDSVAVCSPPTRTMGGCELFEMHFSQCYRDYSHEDQGELLPAVMPGSFYPVPVICFV